MVQLFCIVPVFFDYVTKESGVMRLVSMATADNSVVDKVADLIDRIRRQGVGTQKEQLPLSGVRCGWGSLFLNFNSSVVNFKRTCRDEHKNKE